MAVVYLDPILGDDARTYAQAQVSSTPWQTPAKVISSAVNGDSITLAAGTYTWASGSLQLLNFTWNGPSIIPLSSGGTGLPTAVFDGSNASVRWTFYLQSHAFNRIKFQNVINSSAGTGGIFDCNYTGGTVAGKTYSFTDCVFTGFRVDDNGDRGGVLGDYFGSDPTFNLTNCLFYDIGRKNPSSYSVAAFVSSRGMHVNFTGCTFHNSLTGSDKLTGFIYNANSALFNYITFKNCVLRSEAALNYENGYGSQDVSTPQYSDFSNMTGSPSGTGVITSDPLIIDYANNIFRLRPTSPCRATGTAV